MKALVGMAPNLPWDRLKNMTEKEIEEFNRRHMVEVEMSEPNDTNHKYKIAEALENDIWNAAIEAAAKMAENRYGNYGMIADEIRKLRK